MTEAGDHDEVVVPDLTVGHIDVRGGVGFTSRSSGQWVKILLAPNRLPDLLRPRPTLFLSTVTPIVRACGVEDARGTPTAHSNNSFGLLSLNSSIGRMIDLATEVASS